MNCFGFLLFVGRMTCCNVKTDDSVVSGHLFANARAFDRGALYNTTFDTNAKLNHDHRLDWR